MSLISSGIFFSLAVSFQLLFVTTQSVHGCRCSTSNTCNIVDYSTPMFTWVLSLLFHASSKRARPKERTVDKWEKREKTAIEIYWLFPLNNELKSFFISHTYFSRQNNRAIACLHRAAAYYCSVYRFLYGFLFAFRISSESFGAKNVMTVKQMDENLLNTIHIHFRIKHEYFILYFHAHILCLHSRCVCWVIIRFILVHHITRYVVAHNQHWSKIIWYSRLLKHPI